MSSSLSYALKCFLTRNYPFLLFSILSHISTMCSMQYACDWVLCILNCFSSTKTKQEIHFQQSLAALTWYTLYSLQSFVAHRHPQFVMEALAHLQLSPTSSSAISHFFNTSPLTQHYKFLGTFFSLLPLDEIENWDNLDINVIMSPCLFSEGITSDIKEAYQKKMPNYFLYKTRFAN